MITKKTLISFLFIYAITVNWQTTIAKEGKNNFVSYDSADYSAKYSALIKDGTYYLVGLEDEKMKPSEGELFTNNKEFNSILEEYNVLFFEPWIPSIDNLKKIYFLKTEKDIPIAILESFVGKGLSSVEQIEWEPENLDSGITLDNSSQNYTLNYTANTQSLNLTIHNTAKKFSLFIYNTQGSMLLNNDDLGEGTFTINLSDKLQKGLYFCILLSNGEFISTPIIITK